MRWGTRQRVTTSKRGPHEPRPWGGSAAAVLREQQGGPRGWSRGRRRWRGRPRRAPWAREDLGCDPRRVGAGEDRARGRTRGLGAQGRPLVAARRQAARRRRSRARGPGNVGREKAGNARPRGPCAPDLLLSPGPCHRGPLQKRLTQGCLLLPRPSRQARLLRPGPPPRSPLGLTRSRLTWEGPLHLEITSRPLRGLHRVCPRGQASWGRLRVLALWRGIKWREEGIRFKPRPQRLLIRCRKFTGLFRPPSLSFPISKGGGPLRPQDWWQMK